MELSGVKTLFSLSIFDDRCLYCSVLSVTYHELDVTAHDIELVLHGELAIEVQQNKGHPGETHSRAGQDAAPQGTVEVRLLHGCSHLLQQGVGSMKHTERSQ